MLFVFLIAADGTDTVAVGPDADGSYRLHGYKWFTSATDAEMAFTLARLQDENGMVAKVSRERSIATDATTECFHTLLFRERVVFLCSIWKRNCLMEVSTILKFRSVFSCTKLIAEH